MIDILRTMANAKDEDGVSFDSVPQDIGPDDRHLAPALSGIPSSLGKFREAVSELDQAIRKSRRSGRVEG